MPKDPVSEQDEKSHVYERQLVIFTLGDEEFGVNINDVREIIRLEDITQVPNTPEHIEGIINLRGGIIIVINLAMKLGLPCDEKSKNTRIIVIEVADNTVGMIVDSAKEVIRLMSDQVKPAPQIITEKIEADYIEGVGIINERLLILLDLKKVLAEEDKNNLKEIQKVVSKNAGQNDKPEKKTKSR